MVHSQMKKLKFKFTLGETVHLKSVSSGSLVQDLLDEAEYKQQKFEESIKIEKWKRLSPIDSDVSLRDDMQKILNRVNEKAGREVFRLR